MSHLAHIVKLKQALISEGITNPEMQIAVVRTCYVKALITVNSANKLDEEKCIEFNRYILSYWNEVTPVNGLVVMSMIGNFFRALEKAMNHMFTDNKLEIDITPKVELPLEVDYQKLDAYAGVIQTLIDEANFKLPQFMETSQVN